MPLTDTAIKAAKSKEKIYRLADGRGLFLEVPVKGSKRWRFRYRFEGKENMLSLGVYPDVTLRQARDRCHDLRNKVADGINPGKLREEERAEKKQQAETFEAVAREWFELNRHTWTKKHATTIMARLENNVFPWLGSTPIIEIEPPDILTTLRRIEARGAVETAHRVKGIIGQVFRFAVATGKAQRDQSADLRGALQPVQERHLAAITDPKDITPLLHAIDGYKGSHIVRCALKFSVLTFARPGEIRHAEWSEIDFDAVFEIVDAGGKVERIKCPAWCIPAEKMKARRAHIVPLSRQAVEVLKDLQPLTGNGRYLFPSVRTAEKPISENTTNTALRRMGYEKKEMCAHGFRTMASTRLNEMGWNRDWIERQLSHVEESKVRGAYNRAEFLPGRIKMVQAWADYLDGLRNGGKVLAINAAQGA